MNNKIEELYNTFGITYTTNTSSGTNTIAGTSISPLQNSNPGLVNVYDRDNVSVITTIQFLYTIGSIEKDQMKILFDLFHTNPDMYHEIINGLLFQNNE